MKPFTPTIPTGLFLIQLRISTIYPMQHHLMNEGVLTFSNGNLIKSVQIEDSTTYTSVYTYDDKNNPFKNILGFRYLIGPEGDTEVSVNNLIQEVYTTTYSGEYSHTNTYTNVYTYDDNGFPIKADQYHLNDTDGSSVYSSTTEFFY